MSPGCPGVLQRDWDVCRDLCHGEAVAPEGAPGLGGTAGASCLWGGNCPGGVCGAGGGCAVVCPPVPSSSPGHTWCWPCTPSPPVLGSLWPPESQNCWFWEGPLGPSGPVLSNALSRCPPVPRVGSEPCSCTAPPAAPQSPPCPCWGPTSPQRVTQLLRLSRTPKTIGSSTDPPWPRPQTPTSQAPRWLGFGVRGGNPAGCGVQA